MALNDRMEKTLTLKWWIPAIVLVLCLIILASLPLPEMAPVNYIDRETGHVRTEQIAGEDWLNWLYHNPVGKATLWTFAKRKFVSSIYGYLMDRTSSAKRIDGFINTFDIDTGLFETRSYTSFNDFFARKLKPGTRHIDSTSTVLPSPADGKILAYQKIPKTDFRLKGTTFNLPELLENDSLAAEFNSGSLLIVRLAPPDYHRFHFPVDGLAFGSVRIEGDYYSVNPIALRQMAEIFLMNKREYTLITNTRFGDLIIMEVGATMVGSVIQTYHPGEVYKGQEKGYFKFGGSTVVMIMKEGTVRLDNDLIENTQKGLETSIRMGERVGTLNL